MNLLRGRGVLVGLAMLFAVLGANSGLTLLNLRRLHNSSDRLAASHDVVRELSEVQSALILLQVRQRGFVILGEDSNIALYQQARAGVRTEMQQLARLLPRELERQRAWEILQERVATAMQGMDRTVQTRQSGGFEAARTMIATGGVRQAMDAALAQATEMQRSELSRLAERSSEAHVSYWTALATTLLSTLFGAVLVVLSVMAVRRELASREVAARELREANERLEERVRERTATLSETNSALRDEINTRRAAEESAHQFAGELQRSNRELEQFAAVASHDLQEPLRKIQAFGDRLRNHATGLDERAKDYLDRMLSSAGRMRTLIDDLLTFSRVSTRAQPFAQVNLNEVARGIMSDLEERLQRTGARVELGELPTIEAEPVQMRQLMLNLVGNALKFRRPDEPPVVRVASRLLATNGDAGVHGRQTALCEIEVADNGIGFEQQYTDRIFELFQRLHPRHEYEGTGMGLAICRKIVERHGGQISARSQPGEGSRFTVTLPVVQPARGVEA